MERLLHATLPMDPVEIKVNGRSDGKRIDTLLEQLYRRALEKDGRSSLALREWLDRAEAWLIVQVLHECRGNRSAAARALGIGRRTLYTKMDRLGVGPAWGVVQGGEALARGAPGAALAAAAPAGLKDST